MNEFVPDVVMYNAGTDILDGDPLGCLSITANVSITFCKKIVDWHLKTKEVTLIVDDVS